MLVEHGIVRCAYHAVKQMALSGERQKLIRTESLPPLVGGLCATVHTRIDDVTGIFIRKRLEQHIVDNAENRGAGADAEPESDDRHGGKSWIAPKLAKRIAQVLQEVREEVGHAVSRRHQLLPLLGRDPESLSRQQALRIQLHQHGAASLLIRRATGDQLVVTVFEM